MLTVDIENIFTEDEVTVKIHEILAKVVGNNEVVVVTHEGHPAAAIIDLKHLEELSGRPVDVVRPGPLAGPAPFPEAVAAAPQPETQPGAVPQPPFMQAAPAPLAPLSVGEADYLPDMPQDPENGSPMA